MRCLAVILTAGVCLGMIVPAAWSTTYLVKPDGTGDFKTIQAAVNAVAPGDTILLANGEFTGDGNRDIMVTTGITIRSQSGNPDLCRINCGGTGIENHGGFAFYGLVKQEAVLENVKIMNGYDFAGAAIDCAGMSPTITGCKIVGNTAGYGGGILCQACSPTITGCKITGNTAFYNGGGIFTLGASPTVAGCTITENWVIAASGVGTLDSNPTAAERLGEYRDAKQTWFPGGGGICCMEESAPTLTGNTVSGNGIFVPPANGSPPDVPVGGGGIACQYIANATIKDCDIIGNDIVYSFEEAMAAGGGLFFFESAPVLDGCTIMDNDVGMNPGEAKETALADWAAGMEASLGAWPAPERTDTRQPPLSPLSLGGGVCCVMSPMDLMNSTISQNSAYWGGGFYVEEPIQVREKVPLVPRIASSTIATNFAYVGGGIVTYHTPNTIGQLVIEGSTISANAAMSVGGVALGMFAVDAVAGLWGEFAGSDRSQVDRTAIPAIGRVKGRDLANAIVFANTILWGNCDVAGVGYEEGYFEFPVAFTCCDVNAAGIDGAGTVTWVGMNFFTDPMFCCPVNCDLIWSQPWPFGPHKVLRVDYFSPCTAWNSQDCGWIGANRMGCRGNRCHRMLLRDGDDMDKTTAVAGVEATSETLFGLLPPAPNPFNPSTEVTFAIPLGSDASRVTLAVYNSLGQKVRTLVDGDAGAGVYHVIWDGTDENGASVASGVYFCNLRWEGRSETQRMVLLK